MLMSYIGDLVLYVLVLNSFFCSMVSGFNNFFFGLNSSRLCKLLLPMVLLTFSAWQQEGISKQDQSPHDFECSFAVSTVANIHELRTN